MTTVTALLDELRAHQLLTQPQLAALAGQDFADAHALVQDLLRRAWITPYQADRLLEGKGAELVQGDHVLLEPLGEGPAFKARGRATERIVAFQVVRTDLAADPEAFQREMAVARQLDHPHLARIYDSGPLGATHFLAAEHVEGTDLESLVKKAGPLPIAAACHTIRQAALGLQHIHEHSLVHRDIKPAHLLVSGGVASGESGGATHHSPLTTHHIKILNLGLARFQESPHGKGAVELPDSKSLKSLTLDGSVSTASIDYLAPEQALGLDNVDIRGDIYSLGCTLFFALTGRAPFGDGPPAMKLMRHQQAPPPDPRRLRPDVPPALAAIVQCMLAKRPQDRYQTPREVADALAPLCAPAATPQPRRGKLIAALLALAFIVGIAAAVVLSGAL